MFSFFIFPFEKVEKGADIVIYGVGRAGKEYVDQIDRTEYCNIICLLDTGYKETKEYKGYAVCAPEEIADIPQYDYVLVSVQLEKISKQIEDFLLSMGVPQGKIIRTKNRRFSFSEEDQTIFGDLRINSPCGGKQRNIHNEYIEYVEGLNYVLRNKNANKYFEEIADMPFKRQDDDTKLIAWYLPQFYKMDVNDKYHGMGFTEWTNTTRTIPMFTGHYQPRLPYDMGFYNLTDIEAIKRQVELAKMYGIYGFCFHYYWFSGVKTMEKPIELFLEHKELDIKFCIHWCTENWTALWDGEDRSVIFEQRIEDSDDEKFMRDILPYMKDERYIKIDGKPVLMVYRVNMFEKERFAKLIINFRKSAQENGFPGLYVMITTSLEFLGKSDKLSDWEADALVEYPTATLVRHCPQHRLQGYVNRHYFLRQSIFDVEPYVNQDCYLTDYEDGNIYRAAMVNFDSTPRKANSSDCFLSVNSTPENYKKWLKSVIRKTKGIRRNEENYVFVFAWNEWAESAYLEPDMLYGYAYLQATKEAVEELRPIRDSVIIDEINEKKRQGITEFCFYVNCIESIGDVVACEPIARYLKQIEPASKVKWLIMRNAAEVVKWNPHIDEVIEVSCLSEAIDLLYMKKQSSPSNIVIDCHYDKRICDSTRRVHSNLNNPQVNESTYLDFGSLLEASCYCAGLRGLVDSPIFHQNSEVDAPAGLPDRYVVFHCKTAREIKDWDDRKWNLLADYIMSRGFCIVELGFEAVIKSSSTKYYDYTDIRSIQTAAEVIERSVCFIGVDSLFAHVANCFGTYGILLFGKYKNFSRPMVYTGNYANGLNSQIIYARDNLPAKDVSEDDVFWEFKRAVKLNFGIDKQENGGTHNE